MRESLARLASQSATFIRLVFARHTPPLAITWRPNVHEDDDNNDDYQDAVGDDDLDDNDNNENADNDTAIDIEEEGEGLQI